MRVEGMANICLCVKDIQAALQVAVCSELKETMIISCDDLHKLRIIPADFPNTVLAVKTNKLLVALNRKLLTTFDKTLSNELNPSPMNSDPMYITLQTDAIPICVTTARRVPKHYGPESKKTLTELIERKVITPVDEPTTWCSPAFFVPKADGKRVHLVTDFTALNKFVQRPTHPFPSTREIMEAIPPDGSTRLLPAGPRQEIKQINDLPHTAGAF